MFKIPNHLFIKKTWIFTLFHFYCVSNTGDTKVEWGIYDYFSFWFEANFKRPFRVWDRVGLELLDEKLRTVFEI